MIIRSKSALRISFAGGGTDISPYLDEKGGMVLCATIDKFCYATLKTRPDNIVKAYSLDYDDTIKFGIDGPITYDGKLDLVKAAIKVLGADRGIDLYLHNDVPPGSGLGSSSSLCVALVNIIKHWRKLPFTDYDIAELAYRIERQEVGISGGKQDQYASAFGDFNLIEFYHDRTIVNPLRINRDIINELEYRLMLCYVGKRDTSAGIIEDQIRGYSHQEEEVVRAMDATKQLVTDMKNALLLGRLNNFGAFLNEGWNLKKKFSSRITDPKIDDMYELARKNGAIGGKLLGAGGGGYLLLFCEFDKWHKVADALERAGGQISTFSFFHNGPQTWEIKNS